ncbi:S8 family serine peptidase [Rugosimonospora africana]|uniref:Peptidase n=1 Tax=Rugosimonospora africana TaxID=556532 RepID=A0A8J3VWF1_9ACTN|nr:S8 family serine peptidase [Rugosimonospora africana]GIH21250.1 peptidase [Rugosimonospora africana]
MRIRSVVLALALFAGTAGIPAASSAAASPAAAPATATAPTNIDVVTLVTGDVVRLDTFAGGIQRATVIRATDPRSGIHTFSSGGDVYVEPGSASALLASGVLDEQLFDVSALVRQGYDDAGRASLPLILGYRTAVAPRVAPAGSRVQAALPSAHALAVAETKSQAAGFWTSLSGNHDIARVWLDAKVHATLDQSVPQIGGPAAWARGYDGKGVQIAVLDSGIDATHPDFARRISAARDFTGGGDTVDRAGHGTHVASIAAGTGAASDGRYRGVAPAADLMIGKVLGDDGSGLESWVIDGMQWAASHGADVVNLSLGGPVTKGDDPLSQALDTLSDQYHTLFVVAAGNTSPGIPGTPDVTAPGAASAALTVGAVTKSDVMWSGSRNGLMGDAGIKPEIVAPGANITAAGTGGELYRTMTGTSMAAPHVAGAVALLVQEHPDWGPAQLKAALTSTAKPLAGADVFRSGAGRVDIDRATRQQVHVDQGVLDLGYFARPYDPATLYPTRTLTYTNDSAEPVTLHLTAQLASASITPATLTIAPHAQARADLTLDAATAATGAYSGRVTATGDGGLEIDTALGFYKQDDTVDVTFRALDRDGNPGTARLRVAPYLHNDGRYYPDNIYLSPDQTEWTLRLPEGDYNLFGLISTPDASGRWFPQDSIVGNPKLSVHAPNFTVTLDARTARPLSLQTPKTSSPHYLTLDWSRGDPDNPVATYDDWYWDQTDGAPTQVSVAPTQRVDDAPFSVATTWDAGVPLLDARLLGKPLPAVFSGGPFIDGKHRYPVVDADAHPRQVRGAVALVREQAGVPYDDQVRSAADAGAAVVALYSAQPGAFYPVVGGPVPVIALSREDGQRLRTLTDAHRSPQLELTGTPRTPYAYDLTLVERQRVGIDLGYRVSTGDLAQVDAHVYTTGTGEAGWLLHQDTYTGCGCAPPAVGDYVPSTGYTRTEYVTARPDIIDYTAWQYRVGLPADIVSPRAGHTYRPGQHTAQDWLKAPFSPGVANSGNGDTRLITRRVGSSVFYSIAGFTDSAGDWTRQLTGSAVSSALYLGDKQLYSSASGLTGTVTVPADPGQYRLVTDVTHDGSVVGLSTQAHTEWTFTSTQPPPDQTTVLPLIDIDYTDITDALTGHAALDLANTARTSRIVSLQLASTHQIGSSAPAVDHLTVQVSYDDGATWRPASTRPTGHGTFQATYPHPARGQYVSLKVTASDDAGNSEQQTLIRAYRLG